MAKVIYRGMADKRILNKAHLATVGVEDDFRQTTFIRNAPTEVSDNVAEALIKNDKVFGKFELEQTDTELDIKATPVEAAPVEATPKKSAASK